MGAGAAAFLLRSQGDDPLPPITGKPDLVPTSMTSPRFVYSGAAMSVTVATFNQGTLGVNNIEGRVYLSKDKVLDASDPSVLTVPFGGLNPGTGISQTLTVTVPASAQLAPGAYLVALLMDADSAIAELDETNNVLWSATPLEVFAEGGAGTGLSMTAVNSAQTALTSAAFLIDATISNPEAQNLSGVQVIVGYVDDQGLETELAPETLPAASESSLTVVKSVSIATPGRYRAFARLLAGTAQIDFSTADNRMSAGQDLVVYDAASFPFPTTARPLIPGDSPTFEGEITAQNPVVAFEFNASADIAPNYLFEIQVIGLTGFDPSAEVMLPSGTNLLRSDDDDGVSGARLRLTFTTGRFYLTVQAARQGEIGTFRVLSHVYFDAGAGDTTLGVVGVPKLMTQTGLVDVTNSDSSDDVDEYSFYLPFKARLKLTHNAAAEALRPPVLRDLAGTSVELSASDATSVEALLPAGGYLAEIRPKTGQGSAYELTWTFPATP